MVNPRGYLQYIIDSKYDTKVIERNSLEVFRNVNSQYVQFHVTTFLIWPDSKKIIVIFYKNRFDVINLRADWKIGIFSVFQHSSPILKAPPTWPPLFLNENVEPPFSFAYQKILIF